MRRTNQGTVLEMKFFDLARIAALSLLVGGCVTGTTATNAYYTKVGVPDIFRYAAVDRDFLTEIHGNPSAASKAAFDASVMAVMPSGSYDVRTNFTTNPSADAREGYRLVMVFSGDPYFSGEAVCGNVNEQSLKPVSGRVEIQAAFCYRDDALSAVHVAYPQGSQGLKGAVSSVVLNLFPRVDPYFDPGGNQGVLL